MCNQKLQSKGKINKASPSEHPDRQKMESLNISKPLNQYTKKELQSFSSTFGFKTGKLKDLLVAQLCKKMASLGMQEPTSSVETGEDFGIKAAAGGSSLVGRKRLAEDAEKATHASAPEKKKRAIEQQPGTTNSSQTKTAGGKKSGRGQKRDAEDDAHAVDVQARLKEEEKERARAEKERMKQVRAEEAQKAQNKLNAQKAKHESALRNQANVLKAANSKAIAELKAELEAQKAKAETSAQQLAGAATNRVEIAEAVTASSGHSNGNIHSFLNTSFKSVFSLRLASLSPAQ